MIGALGAMCLNRPPTNIYKTSIPMRSALCPLHFDESCAMLTAVLPVVPR